MSIFNPSGVGIKNGHIFSLPHEYNEAQLVLLPIPWEVTVSYNAGTANGPEAILEASSQLDLFDAHAENQFEKGIYMLKISEEWKQKNKSLRIKANEYIKLLETGIDLSENVPIQKNMEEINDACDALRKWIFEETTKLLNDNKLVGIVGGDHSTPLGFFQAMGKKYGSFALVQFDAHADLRDAYEGFTYSHASVMFNALKIEELSQLVQIGIRDLSPEEYALTQSHPKIKTYFDWDLKDKLIQGSTWSAIVEEIIADLPQHVYISFDIDGLERTFCPNTGTPVAGGYTFDQAVYIIRKIVDSGRTIIGFDLNEVSPGNDEWDANVGARLLYKLCGQMLKANSK